MRGPGMKRLCSDLVAAGFDLAEMDAVEVFGRKGDWHTIDYADRVRNLEVWEIDPGFNSDLKQNLPGAQIKNVDSIRYIKQPRNDSRFDFIVIDNPQSRFGPEDAYCEHFDILLPSLKALRPNGVVVFNVNIRPYDYDLHPEWRRRREEFYGRVDTDSMEIVSVIEFYGKVFDRCERKVTYCEHYARNDFLHYLVYRLAPKTAAVQGTPTRW